MKEGKRAEPMGTSRARRSAARVLLLIPARTGPDAESLADRPTPDHHALRARLLAQVADFAVADADPHPLVRLARRAGPCAALAAHAFLRRKDFDVIFSNAESVGLPLAVLLSRARGRPRHLMIGHRLSAPKKRLALPLLGAGLDDLLVYSTAQEHFARERLPLAPERIHRIPFHADARFFRPVPGTPRRMIFSAGLESRDYPTLLEAVRGLPVEVRLTAASPFSRRRGGLAGGALPPNVSVGSCSWEALRRNYQEAALAVVPLLAGDFQAGVTAILEAMAMGKAVVATRTEGQRDVVEDGVHGLCVPPGNPAALRWAIAHLLDHPDQAARMGAEGRRLVEERMSLDLWVERVAAVALPEWRAEEPSPGARGALLGGVT